jgi:hypothetical protein
MPSACSSSRLRSAGTACRWLGAALLVLMGLPDPASAATAADVGYTTVLDPQLSFFEATLDARELAPQGTRENLVPRGIILPLGRDTFVCFDTELLRVAAIWNGGSVTPHGMAMYSYADPLREIPGGQRLLSKPAGRIWASTGLYPGWSDADRPVLVDPRARGADPSELGRGPLPPAMGRWRGIADTGTSATLRYSVGEAEFTESFSLIETQGRAVVERRIAIRGLTKALRLVVNDFGTSPVVADQQTGTGASLERAGSQVVLHVRPSARTEGQDLAIVYQLTEDPIAGLALAPKAPDRPRGKTARWTEVAHSDVVVSPPQGAYQAERITVPYPNPWQRRIRPIDLVFRADGTALVLAFDGDVYAVSGLDQAGRRPEWRRIAAGFNEPQAIQLREGKAFVFSRLGVTELVDHDGDGETDEYALFTNAFAQSAETRDYPLSLLVRPDGSFLVAKGGQGALRSIDSGRVLHVSADGQRVEPFAYGLRNGILGANPLTGLVTSTDQQGNWVPTSPVFKISRGAYFGYEPGKPTVDTTVSPPLVWLPHRAAQSTVGQLSGFDDRAGPLKDAFVVIDYHRPGLAKILLPDDDPDPVQAAAVSLGVTLPIPAVRGRINPADGLPYFVGFKIEGSVSPEIEGLCRVRPIQATDGTPVQAEVRREGVLLRFAEKLDPARIQDLAGYEVNSWEYRRTSAYGSGQFRADGSPGIDAWRVHSVWPGPDGRSVFIAIPGLRLTMQLEVKHQLLGSAASVYFTINRLDALSARDGGFAQLDLQRRFAETSVTSSSTLPPAATSEISLDRGRTLAAEFGCLGCHSLDGSTAGRPGPTFRGLLGQVRRLNDGRELAADEAYLVRSILNPADDIVEGYAGREIAMPSYQGVLDERGLQSLILYLKSLR